ncbi:Protein CLT2 chloroplastic [Zea mays]|uniref:Protein CLT2 chloroplastic n=1 Tax=Zea mays TaxID=4577 RepID=A0A1D6FF87_MAIZE|nr:Protein CLT2 chloroplastic [Zea mays]
MCALCKSDPWLLACYNWSNSSSGRSSYFLDEHSGASNGLILFEVKFFWPAVMMISAAFQAAASIIKEFVFIDGAKCLEGKRPDIFVVNSFGSGFQVRQ